MRQPQGQPDQEPYRKKETKSDHVSLWGARFSKLADSVREVAVGGAERRKVEGVEQHQGRRCWDKRWRKIAAADAHNAQRRASPTAAGEAGGAEKGYANSPRAPSGKRGRRLGAGAPLRHSVATPAADPIKQQESANEEWEYSIEGVTRRMRMSVNRRKNRQAEE